MATFNPQGQYNDPNYLGYSKSISQPESDKSTGLYLKELGEGIEGAVSLTDQTIKKGLSNDISDKLNKERNEYTDALETIKGAVKPSGSSPSSPNIMDDSEGGEGGGDAPAPIKSGLSKLQATSDAMAGQKISETMFYQRTNSILKDLRSQYPGYRDYIDEQGSKILGVNPANAYLRSMIQDINRNLTGGQREQQYWEHQLIGSGLSGATQMLEGLKSGGKTIADVQHFIASGNEANEKIKADKAAFEMADSARKDLAARAEITATNAATHAATEFFRGRALSMDVGTSQQLTEKINYYTQHPNEIDPNQIREIGTQLNGLMARNLTETRLYLQKVKTKDGQSVLDVLPASKVESILQDSIKSLYGAQLEALQNKDLGLVNSIQNAATDVVSNKALGVLKNPTTGGVAQTGAALNKLMPNMSPDLKTYITGQYGNNFVSDLMKVTREQKKQAIGQTGGNVAGDGNTQAYTFKQAQDEVGQARFITKLGAKEEAEALKDFMGLRKAFLEKDPRVVDNAITTFFHPNNRGTMNKFMDDYYDPQRRVIVTGRTGAYTDLTSPEITKAVWDRAHNGNNTAWDYYKNWATGEAVAGLNTMANTWNTNEDQFAKQTFIRAAEGGKLPSGTDHHFYWDTSTHQIGITDLEGKPMDLEKSWRLNPDLFLVRNANKTIASLKNIAETENKDPRYVDAFIFKQLKDAGWSPKSLDVKGGTVPTRILRAITSANSGEILKEQQKAKEGKSE